MKIFKHAIIVTFFLLLTVTKIFGVEIPSTSDLLMSYLENDNDLKKNAIEAEKAKLSLSSTKIDNGFDVSLSTGTITIKTDTEGTSFSVKPSVQASVPQASNLKVSASTSYTSSNDSNKIENTQLKASVDIISSTGLSRKISLLKAERSLTEATRKLRNQAITTEKAFYSELKELLNSASSLISLEKNLYTNKIDFEKIKAQGYATKSSTYRLAEMKVISAEHEIESSKRALIYSYILFYKKCGFDIVPDEKAEFIDYIPSDITDIEPINIQDYKPEQYSEIENALWTNKINTMQRKTKTNWSLSANGGVTFNNSTTSSDTIDAGLNSEIGGVSLGAGISLPVENFSSPVFTLSATLSPNTFRQNSITQQINELNEKEELINIESAYTNYDNKMVECVQNLEKILWNTKSDEESYNMYVDLEKDLSNWYAQGLITESEYYTAKVNVQSYYVEKMKNTIDLIMYNDNIITMFIDEDNQQGEN